MLTVKVDMLDCSIDLRARLRKTRRSGRYRQDAPAGCDEPSVLLFGPGVKDNA